ncbi:MAG: hypothetical protein FWG30_05935 [Eubacteriaceae bacterium]|nr:hypothetical protein [Eubacteriaceae bacterium]
MGMLAVIDTETTWWDDVMSIGVAIADTDAFKLLDKRYYILTPFKEFGGMYTDALYIDSFKPDLECSREKAMAELATFLTVYKIETIFAYNASFDYRHLPELSHLAWYDIMKLAAYRQHNSKIPSYADCYRTGRLKRGYGVESIYKMLSDNMMYREKHNALADAIDELEIMRLLNREFGEYASAKIR